MRINEIFMTDIGREINTVIKVADQSEEQLREEIDSYVVTEVIERYLEEFFSHYAETRLKETEHIGVWLYGFVGAGKSHFAKIIGLLLSNPLILGQPAIDRFLPRIQACRRSREIERLLFEIRNNIKTIVIPFHIGSEADQVKEENVCRIFNRVFLRHLGLSEDFRIASVEQTLIHAGKYEEFKKAILDLTGEEWEEVRKPDYWDLYRLEIFKALANILPSSFTSSEDARQAFESKEFSLSIQGFAKYVCEYLSKLNAQDKSKEYRLIFIVDELGAFIANSGKRLHDIGTIAEEFAKVGKGKVWIFATGHHSVKDIVENAREFDGDRLWLEGRFHLPFQLTSENIEKVLEERLFRKNTKGESALNKLYSERQGAIVEIGGLTGTSRMLRSYDQESFISCYPFRPYQTILVHEIVQQIRTAGGRTDVLTGSTRTIIGLAQGILKNEAQKEIGYLVPFYKFFEQLQDGVEIPHQIRTEINSVDQKISGQFFPLRPILQTLYLIQQVDYVPPSLHNISLLLADRINTDINALEKDVEQGLKQLKGANYITDTGELYRYISGEERNDAEIVAQSKADVKTVHRRNKLKDEFLTSNALALGTVRYEGRFDFDVRVTCDGSFNQQGEFTGEKVINSKGDLELRVFSPLAVMLGDASLDDLEMRSLKEQNVIYWLSRRSAKIEEWLTTLIGTEKAMRPVESDLSQPPERRKRARKYLEDLEIVRSNIASEINKCLREGHIIFRGSSHSITSTSSDLKSIFEREVAAIIPVVYPEFSRAKYRILDERKTIQSIFSSMTANLKSIESDFGLFDSEGEVKRTTPAVADIIDWLDMAHQKGERITGEDLVKHFSGIPYGWDPNLIRVIACALFRSNLLSVRYEGSDFRDYTVARAQGIFIDSRKFNRALLTLETEEPLAIRELQRARQEVEVLFGTARLQETPFVIAETLKNKANERLEEHRHLKAWIDGSGFPVSDIFLAAPGIINDVMEAGRPNKLVRKFIDNLNNFKEAIKSIDKLAEFYTTKGNVEKFNNMAKFLPIGRFLYDRVSRKEMPNTIEATEFLELRWREKNLLERFSEATIHILKTIPELKQKFDELKRKTLEALSNTLESLSAFGKEEGLKEEELTKCLSALQHKRDVLEYAEFSLQNDRVTIPSLWSGVSEVEAMGNQIRREIEAEAFKKRGKKPPEGKVIKRIRLREFPDIPRIIRNEDDLNKVLKSIEKCVKDALDHNQEVALD
jgi:hypothetical protein